MIDTMKAPGTEAARQALVTHHARQVTSTELAGEMIDAVLTRAPGNGAAIGGIKVSAAGGWFAARPSGTEDIYKIYAESFRGAEHLQILVQEAQAIVDLAIGPT